MRGLPGLSPELLSPEFSGAAEGFSSTSCLPAGVLYPNQDEEEGACRALGKLERESIKHCGAGAWLRVKVITLVAPGPFPSMGCSHSWKPHFPSPPS